jgi:hypothetical protein
MGSARKTELGNGSMIHSCANDFLIILQDHAEQLQAHANQLRALGNQLQAQVGQLQQSAEQILLSQTQMEAKVKSRFRLLSTFFFAFASRLLWLDLSALDGVSLKGAPRVLVRVKYMRSPPASSPPLLTAAHLL